MPKPIANFLFKKGYLDNSTWAYMDGVFAKQYWGKASSAGFKTKIELTDQRPNNP